MMGWREDNQVQFLYAFNLDKVVPPDHLVRQIDGVLDLSWVHKELAPRYSHTGRPSIDPVLMIRMLIVGLRVRHSLGTRTVPRGPAQPRLSLVLRPRHRGQDPRSFGVLTRSQRALPRQRYFPPRVRA